MNQYFNSNNALSKELNNSDYEFAKQKFRFATHDGVFSKEHVDPASEVLLKSMKGVCNNNSMLDLGCGYGVVGIIAARVFGCDVTFADVNENALELTRKNCDLNGVKAEIIKSDCFSGLAEKKFGVIALNPPIHAGKTVTYSMYEQSREHLKNGGKFFIVTFKQHGANSTLEKVKSIYGETNVEIIHKKKGLYVFGATAVKS